MVSNSAARLPTPGYSLYPSSGPVGYCQNFTTSPPAKNRSFSSISSQLWMRKSSFWVEFFPRNVKYESRTASSTTRSIGSPAAVRTSMTVSILDRSVSGSAAAFSASSSAAGFITGWPSASSFGMSAAQARTTHCSPAFASNVYVSTSAGSAIVPRRMTGFGSGPSTSASSRRAHSPVAGAGSVGSMRAT